MFPPSDPAEVRRKLEALCPAGASLRRIRLSYAPVIYIQGAFLPIPMVGGHGNIAKVDDDGVLVHMDQSANPLANPQPVSLPVVPPSIGALGPHFSGGLHLRIPYTAIIEPWEDTTTSRMVNLWLRGAVVMGQDGWTYLPFLWPPDLAQHPRAR